MTILIFFTSKPALLLLNLSKKLAVYRKHFQKTPEDCEITKKKLKLIFSPHEVYSI